MGRKSKNSGYAATLVLRIQARGITEVGGLPAHLPAWNRAVRRSLSDRLLHSA